MSFRGGRGRGGRAPVYNGPPSAILALGDIHHLCQDLIVVKCSELDPTKVPYSTNGRVFLENKTEIGTIDEIFGPLHEMWVAIKTKEGLKPQSFDLASTKMYIDAAQTLPLQRFLPQPPGAKGLPKTVRGQGRGARGGGRGARGTFRGGGGARGASRGGSFNQRGASNNYAPRGGARGGLGFRGGAYSSGRGGYTRGSSAYSRGGSS